MTRNPKAFTADYYGMEYTGDTKDFLDASIYYLGAWEPDVLFTLKRLMDAHRGDQGVFLDVGANVGTHTLFMSKHAAQIHAIEPFPPVLKRLQQMVQDNGIDNVTPHAVGYSNEAASLPYHVPPDENHAIGSFSSTFDLGQEHTVELPLVVGDTHLATQGIEAIDLIKVDIEGYEKLALHGLQATLKRNRPSVVFELNVDNDEGFHTEEELRTAFPADYAFFEIAQASVVWPLFGNRQVVCSYTGGQHALVEFDMVFDRNGRNLVATPAEKRSALGL